MGLSRRSIITRRTADVEVEAAVQDEITGTGSNVGYRRVCVSLRRKGAIARREDVPQLLLRLDPEEVERRKSRKLRCRIYQTLGPNYVWQIDEFDELKPYRFSTHGCTDGYSRRIIWLEVFASNKCPDLIAYYYLKAAKNLNGIPKIIKVDNGTEHSVIEPIHLFLRDLSNESNVLNSFSVVSSPMNQTIEAYWSGFRKDRLGWWKHFLQDLVDLELFNPSDPVQVD